VRRNTKTLFNTKGEKKMNAREAVKPLDEYVNVPLAELVESPTNPRKTFDEEKLEELAESIRSKGVLSPLLARRVNGHFEIVYGTRRYRAAQRAGLEEVPVRIAVLTDAETLEAQIFHLSSVGNTFLHW
jgi:ParB/RepB/Spo0J family partition protein